MPRKQQSVLMLTALAFLITFLIPAGGPAAKSAEVSKASVPAASTKSTKQWDDLVKAAQKEGTVTIYGTAMAGVIPPLREAFKQKFGVNLEFIQGRPPEVLAKINAERNAGLFLADVGHLGETTSLKDVKPLGITVPLMDLLILPEVTNPKNWMGGELPFLDKQKHVLMFMATASPYGVYNTDMVKESDLSSYLDLLKSPWKGKIVLSDPAISGPSPNALAGLAKYYGKDRAAEIFQQLAAQEPAVTRDQRQLLEWVARGRYPIGLGASMGGLSDFRKAGAPIARLKLKEPRNFSGGPGNLTVFSKNPHPNATKLYANWLLSKEGSSIWSQALEYPAVRVDVPTNGLDPDAIPRSGDIFPDEEHMILRHEITKASAKIFEPLRK